MFMYVLEVCTGRAACR